ncbi:MAG: hypothetical protein ACYCOR_07065, partial [Acidobacteriaceae bacterium]
SPSAFKKTECAVPGNPARECDALARFRAVPENRYLHHGLLSIPLAAALCMLGLSLYYIFFIRGRASRKSPLIA